MSASYRSAATGWEWRTAGSSAPAAASVFNQRTPPIMQTQQPASTRTFAEMPPRERAQLAQRDPKEYARARSAWTDDVHEAIRQRNEAISAGERQVLTKRIAALTVHGVPST